MGKKRQDQLHKRRARDVSLRRKVGTRSPRALVLIVCEGEKTEPDYFQDLRDHLRLSTVEVEVFGDECGSDPRSVLNEAKRLMKASSLEYDQVWCVIDVEAYGARSAQLSSVLKEARDAGIKVALSNPCFEVWILFHFERHGQSFTDCSSVIRAVKRQVKNYQKGERVFVAHLADKTGQAISNAKAIWSQHGPGTARIGRNPSTEVHKLVSLLEKTGKKQAVGIADRAS